MANTDVILVDVGQPAWPRWMIYHRKRRRYWSKGLWKRQRREGELWHSRAIAEKELQIVRLGS